MKKMKNLKMKEILMSDNMKFKNLKKNLKL